MAYLDPNRGAREPDRPHRRAGAADRGRKRPRRGGGDCSTARRLRATAEVILCLGRHRLAAAAATVGHRPGRSSARILASPWCSTSRRSARTCRITSTSSCIAECTGPHTYDRYAKPHWSALAGLQYLLTRKGPVASSLFETGGFWYADPDARSPDIQFHLGLGSGIEAGVAAMPQGGVTLNSAYLRPRSRGTVRLASADPAAAPLIDPNYWADPHDREMSIRGLKLAQEIMRAGCAEALRQGRAAAGAGGADRRGLFRLSPAPMPRPTTIPPAPAAWGSDPGAVVDPRLRFNGIDGAARGRRLDHADRRVVQHQRRRDHDRRKGRRHDPSCPWDMTA